MARGDQGRTEDRTDELGERDAATSAGGAGGEAAGGAGASGSGGGAGGSGGTGADPSDAAASVDAEPSDAAAGMDADTDAAVDAGDQLDGGMDASPDAGVGLDAADPQDSGVQDAGPIIPADVVINEVVVTPQQDWSNSDGSGVDFRIAGRGLVSGSDQYIELWNRSGEVVDMSGWSVMVTDSTPARTWLGLGGADLVFSPGSSLTAFQPGGYLVIGNPDGYISTNAYLELFHPQVAEPVDAIEIGGISDSTDYAGDGLDNGAPGAGRNGLSRGAFEEAISRPIGVAMPAAVDWLATYATPGAANLPPTIPDDGLPPVMIDSLGGNDVPVTGPFWVTFDEPLGGESVYQPGAVTLTAGGSPVALHSVYSVTLGTDDPDIPDRQLRVGPVGRLPFGAAIELRIEGVTDRAGNALEVPVVVSFGTESAPPAVSPIRLNEVCVTPVRDWDDSEGGDGIAFNAIAGKAVPDTEDEWIEILNASGAVQNLEDFSVVVYNGPTGFGAAADVSSLADALIFGSGPSTVEVHPGDRLVLGNPNGTISTHTFISLRDGAGALVDFVEIGGTSPSNDRGGDGPDNGAPSPGEHGGVDLALAYESPPGVWHYPDEVVARYPDGTDTDSDVEDWVHQEATPGESNGP